LRLTLPASGRAGGASVGVIIGPALIELLVNYALVIAFMIHKF